MLYSQFQPSIPDDPTLDRSYTVVQDPGSLDALIPLTGSTATEAGGIFCDENYYLSRI